MDAALRLRFARPLPRRSIQLLVVPLRVRGNDIEKNGLLPKRRLAASILPLVSGRSRATHGGDDLGSGVVGKVGVETHGRRIHGKNKSAMRKIVLAISPQCGHSQRMSNTEQIKALIEVRDQLTGEAADLVQLEIDALFAPFDAAVEASHLAAIEKNFPHLALLTA